MTRGLGGSLLLPSRALSSPTPCRLPAHRSTPPLQKNKCLFAFRRGGVDPRPPPSLAVENAQSAGSRGVGPRCTLKAGLAPGVVRPAPGSPSVICELCELCGQPLPSLPLHLFTRLGHTLPATVCAGSAIREGGVPRRGGQAPHAFQTAPYRLARPLLTQRRQDAEDAKDVLHKSFTACAGEHLGKVLGSTRRV